jgi:predicted GNAT superfamily acetyltransferase
VITYRDLTTLEEFAEVVRLEREIWGPAYDDVVPVPILAVSVHSGGILIGAYDERRTANGERSETMIGFVYSLPGIKDGKPTQWSHMAGVLPAYQSRGIGFQLKRLQRERALAAGLDLIQWTYDPLQAMNAHLNFAKLGIVCDEYAVNIYGASASPLHGGNPTDRFVADWWIRKPHVERRLIPAAQGSPAVAQVSPTVAEGSPTVAQGSPTVAQGSPTMAQSSPTASQGSPIVAQGFSPAMVMRDQAVSDAGRINRAKQTGDRFECVDVDLTMDARRLLVEIPMGFTGTLSNAPELALAWRMATREIFTTYFGRGYRAVDFFLDRAARKGAYLLTRISLV